MRSPAGVSGWSPDDNVCTVSLAWYIEDGRYDDVDSSGLHAAVLIRSEEGVMFDPDVAWHVVLLVDETATDDQRAALEEIYLGRAGGIFVPVADTHVETPRLRPPPSPSPGTVGTLGRDRRRRLDGGGRERGFQR